MRSTHPTQLLDGKPLKCKDIREYSIVRHKKRQEFLCCMIEGIIKGRSVVFSEIADKHRQDGMGPWGTQVNILCAVVSIGKMAVPIYFEMLDNNSGNSNAADRISLFKSLIDIIGKDRIETVVMDRGRVA